MTVDIMLNAGWAHGKGWTNVGDFVPSILEIDVPVLESLPEMDGLRVRTELYGYTNTHTLPGARPVLVFRHIAQPAAMTSPRLIAQPPRRRYPFLLQANVPDWPPRRHEVHLWQTTEVMWAKCTACDWWGGVLLHPTRRTEAEARNNLLDQHPEVTL